MPPESSVTDRAADLSAALGLLADETRCAIVLELADRPSDQWSQRGVRFSELRESVDVSDGGRFNYHLNELLGRLVERVGERYRLTGEGYAMAQLVRARHAASGTSKSRNTGTCPHCNSETRTLFEDGFVAIECPEHGVLFDMYLPPAVGESHDPTSIETYAGMRAQWYVELAMRGACAECWGSVTRRTPVPLSETPIETPETTGDELSVEFDCRRCNTTYWLPPGVCVLRHPAVLAFYYEEKDRDVSGGTYHDLDVYDWGYPHVEGNDRGVEVRFVGDRRDLSVTLDESATVIETEAIDRSSRKASSD